MNSEHIGDEAGRAGGSTATLPRETVAWDLLCKRLQRDPATSEESDTCTLRAAWRAMLAFAGTSDAPRACYRHVKRGTVYEIIGGAELQTATGALVDGSALLIYRGEDGKLWAREEGEFYDGRFASMTPEIARLQQQEMDG